MGQTVGGDSVERFAADLRALRGAAGNPILAVLARECGVGRTTLSDAFAGQMLPSANTVSSLVTELGADPAAWLERWSRLRASSLGAAAAPEALGGGASAQAGPARGGLAQVGSAQAGGAQADGAQSGGVRRFARRWWPAAVVGGVCLLIGAGGGFVLARLPAAPPAAGPTVAVVSGDDPWAEPACQAGTVHQASGTRADHYLVEVFWSQDCQAAWGQVTRFDGQRPGNSLTATVYLDRDPASPQANAASDVQTVHTPLLAPRPVQPGRTQTICVTGVARIGSDEIDLSPPVCIGAG